MADAEHGTGVDFRGSHAVAVDAAHNRALFGAWGEDTLLSMELDNHWRAVVSPTTGVEALEITFAVAIALDDAGDTAFVVNHYPLAIVAVDLQTGMRRVISSDAVGVGPMLSDVADVVYDAATDPDAPRLLASGPSLGVVAVNLETGDRTLFSSTPPHGSGEPLFQPSRMRLDPENDRLIVVDGQLSAVGGSSAFGRDAIVAVDLGTGDRMTLASPGVGTGTPLASLYALAFDPASQRAYVAGTLNGQITSVDLRSRERRLVADSSVGGGTRLAYPQGLTWDDGSLLLTERVLAAPRRSRGRPPERGVGP